MKIPERWTFESADVANGFDTHVREQLPWYDLVTQGVAQIARHYIPRGGMVYDIGASNGNIGRALAPILLERDCGFVAIESSPEMARRYDGPGRVEVVRAEDFDFEPFDFGVAMLSLMFLRTMDVAPLLRQLTAMLRPGGALVIVERTLPPPGYLSVVTSRLTLAAKAAAGADSADIIAKELSLAGVQRPIDATLLDEFGAVEWFRFANFGGYVIEGDLA